MRIEIYNVWYSMTMYFVFWDFLILALLGRHAFLLRPGHELISDVENRYAHQTHSDTCVT